MAARSPLRLDHTAEAGFSSSTQGNSMSKEPEYLVRIRYPDDGVQRDYTAHTNWDEFDKPIEVLGELLGDVLTHTTALSVYAAVAALDRALLCVENEDGGLSPKEQVLRSAVQNFNKPPE
jgi:hypothetical protein